jgi:hypothetical protein
LAVSGIVADDFFRAFGAVTAVANPFQVDLIDLDTAPPKLVESIRTQGVVL